MKKLWQFRGGKRLHGHKALSSQKPTVTAPLPKIVVLPLLQHIGDPTVPTVKVGDKVWKGQMVATCRSTDCGVSFSVPIHAPTSGTVIAIELRRIPHPSTLPAECIVIESDGKDEWNPVPELTPLSDYTTLDPAIVRTHVAKAGIVGLGGAGFPTHLKLKPQSVETLILNGAECEPYITCDDRLMQEAPQEIIGGAQILRYLFGGVKRCLIAVEDNKPEAYQALLNAAQGQDIKVVKVPTRYPMGGERQLIRVLTGQEIRQAVIPSQRGVVVHNVNTASRIYRAVHLGEPLIERIVTVTGNGVEKPQNIKVLLGTPMHALIDFCGRQSNIKRLVMGGSMMGFALPDDDIPIVKTTSCLIVSQADDVQPDDVQMPCIRCGTCAGVCPMYLLPQQLYWHSHAKDFKKVQDYHLFDCIECGCCSYVCPSHIPLVGYFRYAKAEVRSQDRERKKAEIAKQRHEFKVFRLEREKAEKAARRKAK